MRPRQWPKNGFVFVALFFDRQLINADSVFHTLVAFFLLCLMSSAVYIMNDLADIEGDRQHPVKRNRPLPSGRLNPAVAAMAAFVLAAGSLLVPFAFYANPYGLYPNPGLGAILLAYLVSQIAYTFYLKHVALVDVLIVATGFILRIAAGVSVIEVQRFSPWLYVFGGFLALFMALGKRRHELVLLGQNAGNHRAILEEYNLDMIDLLINITITSALVAYSLYTFLAEGLPENNAMMLTIPFVLYALFRYLYLIHIRHEGGAPEEILLRDRPLQIDLVLYAIVAYFALYVLS
jgi:4-hydroxybenzoate polyprenyltransferase